MLAERVSPSARSSQFQLDVSIREHTGAYVSIREHTNEHMLAYVGIPRGGLRAKGRQEQVEEEIVPLTKPL